MKKLTEQEERQIQGGEAITLAAIMALLVIGLVSIICYKIFVGNGGKVSLPGGFSFSWGD